MATETEKLKLIKPAGGDYVDVGVLNANMDKIDEFAQDVEDGFLPLTGGTLSGNRLGIANYQGYIFSNEFATTVGHRHPQHKDGDELSRAFGIKNSAESNLENCALIYDFDDSGNLTAYNLFGEHNFVISATTASDDMNVYMKQGMHFKWYTTNHNTLNTPYKKGLTGVDTTSLIMSYAIDQNYGQQVAHICSTNKVYVRYNNNGVISDWRELGGGGMRVPIAYGKGTVDSTSATLTITGKGTIWFTKQYNTGTTTLIIDGVAITNSDIELGVGSGSNTEPVPFDFEKSVSYKITSSGSAGYTTTYYSYQLYK